MKIKRILAYRVELPLHETTYKWSGGKSVTVFDSTIVRVETDTGLVGHGEVCPLGPFYLPAYAEAVRDVDIYIEQPCLTYEECLAVRRQIPHPFVLDENIDDLGILLRAKADLGMDVVNLKISKLGGLTKIKQARDLCVSMGIGMTLEDSWGGDIATAAIAHLAHSTPTEFLFSTTDFNSYGPVSIADGAPQRVNGRMAASTSPGLGITPKMDVLGQAVVVVS